MKLRSAAVACVCVAAAGALGVGFGSRSKTPSRVGSETSTLRAVAQPDDSAVGSAPTLASLERRLRAIEARSVENKSPESAPTETHHAEPRPPPRRSAPTREELDAVMRNETRDRSWADAYERGVLTSFRASFAGSRIREVSCATSLCRVVVEHSSAAEERAFTRQVSDALPEGYASYRLQPRVADDGTRSSIVHVIRAGYANAVFGGA